MNKSFYSRHIHVRLHELAFSAISKNISKFEKHQVGTNQHQFSSITVFLGNLEIFWSYCSKAERVREAFLNIKGSITF